MVRLRSTFIAVALFAASILLSFSIGGEFLHQHLHHHQTQASHDDCPMVQLLVQSFIFTATFAIGMQAMPLHSSVFFSDPFVFTPHYLLPVLRAPPVSL